MKKNGGEVYAQLTHIDLQSFPSRFSNKRFEIIKENLSVKNGELLDIGAHWGYFDHKFEEKGFKCFAVESDKRHLYFLEKLRRADNKKFVIVPESIFSFCKRKRDFDVVLALSIFHHFLKSKKEFYQLKELLGNLNMKELFFQPLHESEKMNSEYNNFNSKEFIDFILKYSCLTKSKLIGEDRRTLYKFY